MNDGEVSNFNPWVPVSAPSAPGMAGQGPAPRRRRPGLIVYWVTFGLLCAAFVGLIAGSFLTLAAIRVASDTMAPTLRSGDTAIYQRGASGIRRGDVVIVQVPGGNGAVLARRVIGLAGDSVKCCTTGGQLTVNGKALAEDYLAPTPYWQTPIKVTVPAGKVWVMADNRGDAIDSRNWGPLSMSSIEGRALLASGSGASRGFLRTPATFTADGLAPADNRFPLPFLLIIFAVIAGVAAAVQGVVGLIVWQVRRGRRRRVNQPQPMSW